MTDAENLNLLTGGEANYVVSLKEKAALGRRHEVHKALTKIRGSVESMVHITRHVAIKCFHSCPL